MPRWPSIIRFGDSSASDKDVAELGFMPTDETILRRKTRGSYRDQRRKCSLAMQAILPKSGIPIDLIVDGDSEEGDTLRIRFSEFMTPDLSDLSRPNLEALKAVFDTFFDVLIENATRREKHADRLVDNRVNTESPRLQNDIRITFFDYMKERVRLNKLERDRLKKNASNKYYKMKRYEVDQEMVDIYRKQGLIRDGNTEQGKR